jgi:hypothetical protein
MKGTAITIVSNALVLGAMLSLSACAGGVFGGAGSLNVHQIGKDSYNARASGTSASMAKQAALSAADSFCKEQKRNVQLIKEYGGTDDDGSKYDDVTFLCVSAGDPDFVRVKKDALGQ